MEASEGTPLIKKGKVMLNLICSFIKRFILHCNSCNAVKPARR